MRKLKGYIKLYFSDKSVRMNVALFFGIILSGFYTIFNFVFGIIYKNVWFITVGAYYALMIAMRYITIDTQEETSDKDVRASGILLMVISVPLTGMIAYSVISERSADYPLPVLLFFFVYALYGILRSVIGAIYSRKGKEESSQYTVTLTSTLLAVFNLQTTVVSRIAISPNVKMLLNFITGAAVSIVVLTLSVRAINNTE